MRVLPMRAVEELTMVAHCGGHGGQRAAHVAIQALDDAVRLRVVRGSADALDAVLAREDRGSS